MEAPAPTPSVPAPIPEVPAPTPEVPAPTTAAPAAAVAPTDMPQDDGASLPEYEALGCFTDRGNERVMRYKLNDPDLTTEVCHIIRVFAANCYSVSLVS